MQIKGTFSPAVISDLLDVDKSTLLRWEREGSLPPVNRDFSSRQGTRVYTQADVRAIARKQGVQLTRRYEQLSKMGDRQLAASIPVPPENEEGVKKDLRMVMENHSLQKFLSGEPAGLGELLHYESLQPETIVRLTRVALEQCSPTDAVFPEIMKVVEAQSRKLAQAESQSSA